MCSSSFAEAYRLLRAGLSALAEQQPGELDGIALAEQLTDLHRLSSVLAAQIVRRVAVFHTRGDAAAEGMTSTSAFLTCRLRMTRAEARQAVVTAARLPDLPGTAEAFASGAIFARHPGLICEGVERIGPEVMTDAEPILLEAATAVDPGRLRQLVRHLRYVVDAEGQDADATADFDRRGLYASTTFDGMIAVDGLLDPDTGAALMAAVNSGPPPSPEDRCSAAQRRADRLGEVLLRSAAVEDGASTGGQSTQLTLTAGIESLQGVPGSPPAYLDWIGPLDVTTARLMTCDCQVTGVVTGKDGSPLDVGWKHRTATGAQRHRTGRPRRALSCPWLRPATSLVRRPPRPALVRRRQDRSRQPGPPVPPPPPRRPPGHLADPCTGARADSASNSTAAHPAKTTRSLSGHRHRRIPRYRPRRRRSATTAATEATISPTSMPIRPVPIATSPTSYPPLPSTAHRTPASAPSRAPLTNHRAVFGRLSPDMRPSHRVGQGLQRPLLVLPPQSTDQPLKGLPADPWRSRTPRTARDRAVPASAVPARTRAARRDGARR